MTEPGPLSVRVESNPSRIVVVGELDLATSEALTATVEPLLAEDPGSTVRLDFSGVTFMDSSGLAAILRMAEAGHEVVLCAPQDPIRRVIAATGLDDVIRVEP